MQPTRREDRTNSILLVIEQNAATRSGMKRLLEMNGYAVTAVADEREAAFVAQQKSYDFILHDSNLPPPESFSAAYRVQQLPKLQHIPLLAISVHVNFGVSPADADADKFSVAYVTNLTHFDGLERLTACLLNKK